MTRRLDLAMGLAWVLAACSGGGTTPRPGDASAQDLGSPTDTGVVLRDGGRPRPLPGRDEVLRDGRRRQGRVQATFRELFRQLDETIQFDPVVDPAQSPSQNAMAVQSWIQSRITQCAGSTVRFTAPATLTVTYVNCSLRNGTIANGAYTISFAAVTDGGTTTLQMAFVFMNLTLSEPGTAEAIAVLNGALVLSTADAVTYRLTTEQAVDGGASSFGINGVTVTIPRSQPLVLRAACGSFTVDGQASLAGDVLAAAGSGDGGVTGYASSYVADFAALLYAYGDCYPSAGSAGLTEVLTGEDRALCGRPGNIQSYGTDVTITFLQRLGFNALSPVTGEATYYAAYFRREVPSDPATAPACAAAMDAGTLPDGGYTFPPDAGMSINLFTTFGTCGSRTVVDAGRRADATATDTPSLDASACGDASRPDVRATMDGPRRD